MTLQSARLSLLVTAVFLWLLIAGACHTRLDDGSPDAGSPAADDLGSIRPDLDQPDVGNDDYDQGVSDPREQIELADDWVPIEGAERWAPRQDCAIDSVPVERAADSYDVPTTRFGFDPDGDTEYLRQVFGAELGTKLGVWFREKHSPGDGFPYDVFAEPGENVEFTAVFAVDREPGAAVTLDFTVLVDYRPVVANLSFEGPDREVQQVVQGSGHRFLSAGRADFIAVTIPAAEFEVGKNHEIAIAMGYRNAGKARFVISQRASLFYGGLEPAMSDVPCTPSQLGDPLNEIEKRLSSRFFLRYVGIFTDPAPAPLNAGIPARPGESHRIYYSALRALPNEPSTFALVPTLNGEPIGPVLWRRLNGPIQEPDLFNVDDRGYFDISLPTEPGVYEVVVQTWEDPWIRWRDFGVPEPPDGYPGVGMVHPTAGSNTLRFVVND